MVVLVGLRLGVGVLVFVVSAFSSRSADQQGFRRLAVDPKRDEGMSLANTLCTHSKDIKG